MKNKLLFVGLFFTLAASGCSRYAGSFSGAKAIPGQTIQNCYIVQFDAYEGKYADSKRHPLFAILWQGHRAGDSCSDYRNMVCSIHGHAIAPSRTKKAIYLLQPDYSLLELSLARDDADHIFSVLCSNPDDQVQLSQDAVWRQKVLPYIKIVS